MEDTIAAISTALGVGAISIIRVSGEKAIEIVNSIYKGKDLLQVPSHTINYGYIVNEGKKIDEVLISVMRAPKTFTAEDVVEINCHGGIAITKKILEILLLNGCRLAEPGEFTKRAFLNGRIDLLEAEGIMDLINAKTEAARSLAINQLSGSLTKKIQDIRKSLIDIISNIEVNIDYPEYDDIQVLTNEKIIPNIDDILKNIEKLLIDSENGRIIKTGIKTVIIGKPNVGKSSLLNRLLEEEKAIVTDIAGTTRDIVEGTLTIDGLVLDIIDTAGIRKTTNKVESIGVKKSLELINKADLVLYVINSNEKLLKEEKELLDSLQNKNHIIIFNKSDLKSNIDKEVFKKDMTVDISIKEDKNIDLLKNKIKEIYNAEKITTSDLTYLTDADSIAKLRESDVLLKEIKKSLNSDIPIDMVEIDIRQVWTRLGEIIGEIYEDELINEMFSRFCLGK